VITGDYILFRNLFAVYDWIDPFIKKIPKSDFIMGLIQQIYPQYTYARLLENVRLEEIFQSFASGNPIHLQIDEKTHQLFNYRYEKIKQLTSEIEVLRNHYEAMTAERNDRDTHIKQLTAYIEELQLHYNAMTAERNDRDTHIKKLSAYIEELQLHYNAMTAERNDRDTHIKQLTSEMENLRKLYLIRMALKFHKTFENTIHFKQQG
jgi:chromosome segregation ATPase